MFKRFQALSHAQNYRVFLIASIVVIGTVVVGLIWQTSRAATSVVTSESETGATTGSATIVQSSVASGGQAVRFGTQLASTARGPIKFADIAAARGALQAPKDANYVLWNPAWAVDRDLEDVFATELGPNDILVLPERAQSYKIDSSEGFRAAGVKAVTGKDGKQLSIVSRYKNKRDARTWFAMARAQRGVLGLGPNAVVEMTQSSWTQERQVEDKGSKLPDGTVSGGRFWIGTDGALKSELVGSQEKVLEAKHDYPYFGNFTMRGRDLGGVAYSAVSSGGKHAIMERLNLSGAWRGFSGVPNGETAGVAVSRATYLISKNILGTRDSTGKRVGSSPIMINSSSGGRIEDTDAGETFAGMLTIWNSSGKHILSNVNVKFNSGPGINLEKLQPGFELEWTGGSIWADYYGKGGKSPKPADQGTNGRMHVNMHAEGGSAKITLRDVDIDIGPTAGALNVQTYGNSKQLSSDVKYYMGGKSMPVKVYGGI